ncbi:RagB/SusD family nutrient uptake outer membrane protein [Paramuribaculum intestinale]|jgi:hypothetical protein|uniref:RagB/SusD family nutrient uptake outer membrane protein n=2 Tax=Paramuribaculum intestinale TaxID=2094151 RepID=UPI000D1F3EBF|nr:RagB/SusD family nutrient uptake outer membrane protein [Paramuribaculum intestinale]MBJ2185125.1 RagB/SusD family nutrient uptake outer membrane protein [Muribaculaceae bacterium]ROS94554.1 RagB/SusD family nutrient uptake outer membrane protein [Muribaculaceae bacterium Isolate-043 (Harlan)]ROT16720.1 RagB/SusD family nutrient uptake outer membrane protein [Muribaculaceae bacterium Isolate-105 (HZI)]RXE62684.1 RagB/SusD family nutrient uptake outer membrane protein [Muribaculaceae bacteriu
MKKIISYLAAPLLLTGCSLDIPYDNQFTDPDAIATPENGRELIASGYSSLPATGFDLAVLSDDFIPTYWASRNPSLSNQYNWQPSALHDLSIYAWPQYYSVISTANALLERLPGITAATDADRREVADLTAEAYTLKAYCYFQLLRLFAADPADGLDNEGIVIKNSLTMDNLPRATVGATIDEIRRLLEEAIATGHSGTDPSWLTADATTLLLAEVELYAGNFQRAATLASSLLDKRGYECFSPSVYRTLWESTSCEEQIFIYNDPDQSQTYYQGIVYDTTTGDYYSVSPSLAMEYTDTDCRKEWTICPFSSQALGSQSFIGKYNLLRREKREIMFVNKMRLSAALFTAAEAWAQAGGDGPQKAIVALNRFLDRRGADPVDTSLSGDALLKEILHQKHLEFLGEGQRYFDLKHYSRLLGSTSGRIPAPGDYRWLWPIPKDEYLYNDNMTQNPGWPKDSFND